MRQQKAHDQNHAHDYHRHLHRIQKAKSGLPLIPDWGQGRTDKTAPGRHDSKSRFLHGSKSSNWRASFSANIDAVPRADPPRANHPGQDALAVVEHPFPQALANRIHLLTRVSRRLDVQ